MRLKPQIWFTDQDPVSKINKKKADPVAHICNPSYAGGGDQEIKASVGKKLARPHLNQ
jgi:hypothetical protein